MASRQPQVLTMGRNIDCPGADLGTIPYAINTAGTITGYYVVSDLAGNAHYHGFLRAHNGTLTTFDVPGDATGANQGTSPLAINPAGMITGWYYDANSLVQCFQRIPAHQDE